MSSSSRKSLENYLLTKELEADICFDVGGAQLPIKGRVAKFEIKNYKIIDLFRPHEQKVRPDYYFDLNEDFAIDYPELYQKADLVICLEVSDYWYNPLHALKQIYNMLIDGGRAIISFQFFYPTHNPIEEDCLRYTEFGIKKMCQKTGLCINRIIRRKPDSQYIDLFWRAEKMRAAKHYDHEVTGWIVEAVK